MVEQQSQADIDALLAEAESLAVEVSGEAAPPSSSPAPTLVPSAPKKPPKDFPPELQRILQLEVPVIVQLADCEMDMEDVLDLNIGSVIEFDKHFNASLELIVGNRQIGLGQAVKVGENFGLRIQRIGTIYDTIKALGS